MTEFERTQMVKLFNDKFLLSTIVVERRGNYASYSIHKLDNVLPEVMQTIPLKMFEMMVEKLIDEGYRVVEQKYSDEDLK